MATTPAGNPYVESSDLVANYPATSLALANRLDKYAVNPFADATARDAAIPTPVQGQLAQTLDDNKVWRYDGTAWLPFSGAVGAANFTDTATGTYTDSTGQSWSIAPGINGTTIDGAGIILSPTWTKQLEPLINDITVTYGTDQSIQQTDSGSIAAYGRREYLLDTTISDVNDATIRGGQVITAQANPLWNLGQISILVNLLDAATTTAVMQLISGSLLRIYNLPAQGPYDDYTGIVEGWADSYNGGNHTV